MWDSIAFWESIGVPAPSDAAVAGKAGYSPTSSSYEKPRGKLRAAALITFPDPNSDARSLTDRGRELPSFPEKQATLNEHHAALKKILDGPQGKLFEELIKVYPRVLTNEQLAQAAGYTHTSSSFEKPRGKLRTYGFAEFRDGGIAATPIVFPRGLK